MRIGITMRGTLVGCELRDSLARDWWTYTQRIAPEVTFLPLPNVGSELAKIAQDLQLRGLVLSGGDSWGDYPERDAGEWTLLGWARSHNIPVLGVCRGMQVLSLHGGGQIVPCANSEHRNQQHEIHWMQAWAGVAEPGSVWTVNSYHNLRVQSVPDSYQLLAHSHDHQPEAFRHKDLPWVGMQWHPERENCDQVLTDSLVRAYLEWCQGA